MRVQHAKIKDDKDTYTRVVTYGSDTDQVFVGQRERDTGEHCAGIYSREQAIELAQALLEAAQR